MMTAGHKTGDKSALPHRATLCAAMAAALASALPAGSAHAQSRNHSCTIIVDDSGIMRPSADATVLSSQGVGGRSGVARVIATNSSYDVSVDAPFGFTFSPNGGGNNTQFSASISSTGATNFFSIPAGISQKVKRGTSTVEVDFKATRFNGSFPAGNYQAMVVLRCE